MEHLCTRLPLSTESPGVHWCPDVLPLWRPVEDQIIGRSGGEDVPPRIRRICAGRGAELLAASKHIRARPFAHFTSGAPHRHAPKAERTNWTVADGTRTTLIQAGSSAACWAMAMQSQNAIWSGFMMGNDWLAPYRRRHGEGASHKCHPLGALTLAKLQPRDGLASSSTSELEPRLIPCVVEEINIRIAGACRTSYEVAPDLEIHK